jgi:hypothetical protein
MLHGGGESEKHQKKCHVLFELTLMTNVESFMPFKFKSTTFV